MFRLIPQPPVEKFVCNMIECPAKQGLGKLIHLPEGSKLKQLGFDLVEIKPFNETVKRVSLCKETSGYREVKYMRSGREVTCNSYEPRVVDYTDTNLTVIRRLLKTLKKD